MKKKSDNVKSTEPSKICQDLISKPDPVSNLRQIKFFIPKNETKLEKLFRNEREDVQKWNNTFWTRHNKAFQKVSVFLSDSSC